MESIEKAIHGMVSKSSGRSESKRTGDLESPKSRGRTHDWEVMAVRIVVERRLIDAAGRSAGR